jgi:hypothetical protein
MRRSDEGDGGKGKEGGEKRGFSVKKGDQRTIPRGIRKKKKSPRVRTRSGSSSSLPLEEVNQVKNPKLTLTLN